MSSRDLLFLHASVVSSNVLSFSGFAGETLCPSAAFAEFDCKPADVVPVARAEQLQLLFFPVFFVHA